MNFPTVGTLIIDNKLVQKFSCEVENMKRLGFKVQKGVNSFYELVHKDSIGSFGGVFKACKINDDCSYALKIQYLNDIYGFKNEVFVNKYLMNKVSNCSLMPCFYGSFKCKTNENIRKILDVNLPETSDVGYMLFEQIDSNLFLKNNHKTIDEGDILNVMEKISYLHSIGIIHQDISFSNIFIRNNEYLIGDYGLSIIFNNNKYKEIIDKKVQEIYNLNEKEKEKTGSNDKNPVFMQYFSKSKYVSNLNINIIRNSLILLNKILDYLDLLIDYNQSSEKIIKFIKDQIYNELYNKNKPVNIELMKTDFMINNSKIYISPKEISKGQYKIFIFTLLKNEK